MMYEFYINPKDIERQTDGLRGENCNIIVETASEELYFRGSIADIESDKITLFLEFPDLNKIRDELNSLSISFEHMDKAVPVRQFNCIDEQNAGIAHQSESFLDYISDVNWMANYELGVGIDVLTNVTHRSAVDMIGNSSDKSSAYSGRTKVKIVSTSKDLYKMISEELSGRYTVGNLELSGSMEYLKNVRYSDKELSIVIIDKRYEIEYVGNYKFALSTEAYDYAIESPDKFRAKYGDYFISDIRKGANFFAVYHCISNTVEELDGFKNEIKARSKQLELITSGEFQDLTKKYHIELKLNIFYEGCDGTIPYSNINDAIDVGRALKWFSHHLQYTPMYAKLTHYSCLPDSPVKNAIPYETDKLLEIKTLYSNLFKLYCEVQRVPEKYNSIKNSVLELYDRIMIGLSKITSEDEFRKKCCDTVKKMYKNLQILFTLLAAKKLEPQPKAKQRSNGDTLIWEYGCFDCENSEIIEIPFKKTYGAGYQETDIILNRAPGKDGQRTNEDEPKIPIIILGYRLTSNWTDGTNGDWWKLTDHGILDHDLNLHISSYFWRGCDWKCEICYIKNELAKFNC